jgi:hypothetical protein
MIKRIKAFFRAWFIRKGYICDHDDRNYGWSYVKCNKCGRVEHNPTKNRELLRAFLKERMRLGHFTEEEINEKLILHKKLGHTFYE